MDDPEPIDKNRHCWLRPLEDPYTKFGTTLPTDGFWSNGWSITKIIFFILSSFLRLAYSSDPWMDFYAR